MTMTPQHIHADVYEQLHDIIPALAPLDEHNKKLLHNLHPIEWKNPPAEGNYNMVVIGAGPAGLVTAAAAAGLGAKVALIERSLMGGDCMNVGCVPSKALIRCARAVADVTTAQQFGVHVSGEVKVDFPFIMERMRRLRAAMSEHDAVERFSKLGVDVFLGEAHFKDHRTITVQGQELTFSRALIATGARAFAPPIKGLEEIDYLTNETVFSLTELPKRLAVIGAGPIGCEMAQAFARFGASVTLIEADNQIMPREDSEAAAIVEEAMKADGVKIICGGKAAKISHDENEAIISLQCHGEEHELRADKILVGAGRAPNVESLKLENAGIKYDLKTGVEVNGYLQTTNPNVYAAGDVASKYKFTHTADAMARIVVRNALFFGRAKVDDLVIPWCTYTDPEVAHVGLYEAEAKQQGYDVNTITIPLSEVDRAILEGDTAGFLKVLTPSGSDKILGATLVARHAGEMISEITAIMVAKKGLSVLANTIHPYPTEAEVIKKAGDQYNRGKLTPKVQKLFSTILSWRR